MTPWDPFTQAGDNVTLETERAHCFDATRCAVTSPRGTWWPSLYQPRGRRFRLWAPLLRALTSPSTYRAKELVPRWAPVVFESDMRRKAHVQECYGIGVDVDAGASPRAAIEGAFGDFYAFVHTTWRSTPAAPRWRVIVPTSRPVSGSEYERAHRFFCIVGERAGIMVDVVARDPSRAWAVPAARPGYDAFEIGGALFDVDVALEAIPEQSSLPPPDPAPIRSVPAYVRSAIEREAQIVASAGRGGRNAALNRSAFALARFVADGQPAVDDFDRVLLAAGRSAGLPERECLLTLRSALRGRRCA